MRHRYILHCHELFESEHTVWVVMEIIRGGELLDILVEQGIYGEEDASRTMKQTLLAVRYLHSRIEKNFSFESYGYMGRSGNEVGGIQLEPG